MATGGPGHEDDGVRITRKRGRMSPGGALGIVALLVAVVVAVAYWRRVVRVTPQAERRVASGEAARESTAAASPADAHARPSMSSARPVAPADGVDPTTDLSAYVLPGEAPPMAQVIEALHRRGIRSGLGAFPPPGTSPLLRGLVVPADFPLPPGYVRHHQVTDDGRRIAPILMFSPDIDTIVVRGRRVPVPADRIVPPELAPPGMPLRWVTLPPSPAVGTSP